MDGSGTRCAEAEGTTDASGRAIMLIRLYNNYLPYAVSLIPSATVGGQGITGQASNVFRVDSFDTYTGPP